MQSASTIELENFITGFERAAPVDVRCSTALLKGGSILTDISPPDIVQGTVWLVSRCFQFKQGIISPDALAVNSLGLARSNDDI